MNAMMTISLLIKELEAIDILSLISNISMKRVVYMNRGAIALMKKTALAYQHGLKKKQMIIVMN